MELRHRLSHLRSDPSHRLTMAISGSRKAVYEQAAAKTGMRIILLASPGETYTTQNGYVCTLESDRYYVEIDRQGNNITAFWAEVKLLQGAAP